MLVKWLAHPLEHAHAVDCVGGDVVAGKLIRSRPALCKTWIDAGARVASPAQKRCRECVRRVEEIDAKARRERAAKEDKKQGGLFR